MWIFGQKPGVTPLSEKMRLYLAQERSLSNQAAASLRMIEKQGRYSGRSVTYFRVFDPATTKAAGIDVRHFDDLDTCTVLHTGHTEGNGHIMMNQER